MYYLPYPRYLKTSTNLTCFDLFLQNDWRRQLYKICYYEWSVFLFSRLHVINRWICSFLCIDTKSFKEFLNCLRHKNYCSWSMPHDDKIGVNIYSSINKFVEFHYYILGNNWGILFYPYSCFIVSMFLCFRDIVCPCLSNTFRLSFFFQQLLILHIHSAVMQYGEYIFGIFDVNFLSTEWFVYFLFILKVETFFAFFAATTYCICMKF